MRLSLLFVTLTAMTGVVFSQTAPELERGFRPEQTYQFNGVDTINLWNGNLTLRVPLASYPVAADVGYDFVLRYSGNLWGFYVQCPQVPVGSPPPVCTSNYFPLMTNAGLGWRFTLGELQEGARARAADMSTMLYRDAEGTDHYFYNTLHDPVCTTSQMDCDPEVAGVLYSRDGSYLRLRDSGGAKVLEFPDGRRQRFVWDSSAVEWRLTYIYGASSQVDSNGIPTTNWVKVEYLDVNGDQLQDIRITDCHGRSHNVVFRASGTSVGPVVDRFELSAVGGVKATYDLLYQPEDGAVAIAEPGTSNPPPGTPADFAKFLSKIILPTGEVWEFKYDAPAPPNPVLTSGTMKGAILPTGGSIQWLYQTYLSQSRGSVKPLGVSARCLMTSYTEQPCSVDTGSISTLQREYTKYESTYGSAGYAVAVSTITKYVPTGQGGWGPAIKSVSYFDPLTGTSVGDTDDGTTTHRKESSATSACDAASLTCQSTAERRVFLKFEQDQLFSRCDVGFPCERDLNKRVVSDRTSYVTDNSYFVDTDRSDFDGLGHYRLITTSIPGTMLPTTIRSSYTAYNVNTRNWSGWSGSSVGTYALNSDASRRSGFTMLGSGDSWMLNTYTTSWVQENGVKVHAEACFDPRTGSLARTRKKALADGSNGVGDLLAVYTADSSGYSAVEEYFGGDLQAVPTGTLCTLTPPSHNASSYRIAHTYAAGVLKTSIYKNPDGTNLPFYSLQHSDIDTGTGLVRETKDAAGLITKFDYDLLGRITTVTPPTGTSPDITPAPTTYTYNSTTLPLSVDTVRDATTDAVKSRVEFDPFGRVARTKSLMPHNPETSGDRWSSIDVEYDALGRKTAVSEPYVSGETSPVFTRYAYDIFGRTTSITAPDTSVATFVYRGIRERDRISSVWTASGATTATVTETYDALNRLVKVREKSGSNATDVTTTYTYDAADHLASVLMKPVDGSAVQQRIFDYDGRGYLRWETQPESGMAAYTYDARGHVRSRIRSAADTQFDLKYQYDAAERLNEVQGRNPFYGAAGQPQFRPLKTFDFGSGGRLLNATRHNYGESIDEPEYEVKDAYGYDTVGRLNTRTTTITEVRGALREDLKSLNTNVSFNGLDGIKTLQYPMCEGCGVPPTDPSRSGIIRQYSAGRLQALSGFVTQTSFWPNGMRNELVHANGIADTQTITNMPRPSEISFGRYDRCVRPSFVIQPASGEVAKAGDPAPLTVIVNGTQPMQYEWWDQTHSAVVGTAASINVFPTEPSEYFVRVTNGCGFEDSQIAEVTIASCAAPKTGWIEAVAQPDGSWVLKPDPTARQPRTFEWRRLADNALVGTTETLAIGVLSTTTTFRLTLTDACGTASGDVTITVPLPITTGLTATAASTNAVVNVTWPAIPGATQYTLERRSAGGVWAAIAITPNRSFADTSVAAATTYVYRVTSDNDGRTDYDVATTMSFTPAFPGGNVTSVPINDALAAVNKVRAAAGWPAVTWGNVLSATDPLPVPGAFTLARHVMGCRARMDEALQALGVRVQPYTEPDLTRLDLKAVHINEIQQRAQ